MSEPVVRRGALAFKGDKPLKQSKRKREKPDDEAAPSSKPVKSKTSVETIPGDGRVVSSGTTLQGMETRFKEQLAIGDVIMVRHPQSLLVEERIVTGIMSQRSLTVHSPFSSDFVSTTEYVIRKDSERLWHKAHALAGGLKKEELAEDEDGKRSLTVDEALQAQLKRKLLKEGSIFTYQEKTGMWGYKTVSVKVDQDLTKEDLLEMRSKKVHDKYC